MRLGGAIIVGLFAGLAQPACAEFRDHDPFARGTSTKGAAEIAGCMALALGNERGVEVRSEDREKGITLTVKVRSAGIAITNTVIDIIDRGDEREALGYAMRRPKKPSGPFASTLQRCL